MSEVQAAAMIAQRDVLKFLRDRTRIVSSLVFPVVFIVILGQSFQSVGAFDFDYRTFVFLGVLGQTLFQSSSLGIVSLIEDRENDFSQAIFVAPISRYTIVAGKIGGEALVALAQGVLIIAFGWVIQVPLTPSTVGLLFLGGIVACLFGGAFGLIIMVNLSSQRAANQVFPFIFLPQFFLAGVFNPIGQFGPILTIASLLTPMRYPIDLLRGLYYGSSPEGELVVLLPPYVNMAVILVAGTVFVLVGTALFVRRERNR